MAYGTFLHLERDLSYQPSTVDWLGPRVSFSTDFAPISVGIKKDTSEDAFPTQASGKDSSSEFEFSMSCQGQDRSCGSTMLPADELFYEGKLLPLHVSQQLDLVAGLSLGTTNGPECVKANGFMDIENEDSTANGPSFSVSQNIDSCPVSPKAPTCTSRWKEIFGLKKMYIHEVKDAHYRKQQFKASSQIRQTPATDPFIVPGRSSDAGKEPRGSSRHSESNSFTAGLLQDQCAPSYQFPFPPEPCPSSDSGSTNFHFWQADRATSGSRSSKNSDDSDGVERIPKLPKPEGSIGKLNNSTFSQTKSPAKSSDLKNAGTGSRNGQRGLGAAGGPLVGSRATESSKNAISGRKAVRSLDRSYSSSKGLWKKPEQARPGRQSSGALERSTSYPASVRVSPVINVPLYISPVLRKGSKHGLFGLSQFFSSKKEKISKSNNRATS